MASPRLLCLIDNTYLITNGDLREVQTVCFLNYFRVFLQPQRLTYGDFRSAVSASKIPTMMFLLAVFSGLSQIATKHLNNHIMSRTQDFLRSILISTSSHVKAMKLHDNPMNWIVYSLLKSELANALTNS